MLDSLFGVIALLATQQPDDVIEIGIPVSLPGDAQTF
jgi:hypothetical protein